MSFSIVNIGADLSWLLKSKCCFLHAFENLGSDFSFCIKPELFPLYSKVKFPNQVNVGWLFGPHLSSLLSKVHDKTAEFEKEKFLMQKEHTHNIQELLDETNQRLKAIECEYVQKIDSLVSV